MDDYKSLGCVWVKPRRSNISEDVEQDEHEEHDDSGSA